MHVLRLREKNSRPAKAAIDISHIRSCFNGAACAGGAAPFQRLPTFIEIQQELINRGYKLKADGVIGKDTLAAWKKEICNEYAAKYFEPQSAQRSQR